MPRTQYKVISSSSYCTSFKTLHYHRIFNFSDQNMSFSHESESTIKFKIPQITTLNNFTFTDEGIGIRKAYNIGEGEVIGNVIVVCP